MKKWLALVLLFFLVYWFRALPQAEPSSEPNILGQGAVWLEANASVAFVDVNTQRPTLLQGLLFSEPLPEDVVVWNVSDQRFFQQFSTSLTHKLAAQGVPSYATTDVNILLTKRKSVLIVAQTMPQKLSKVLPLLLAKGWVVAHIGGPFEANFSEFVFKTRDALKGDYEIASVNAPIYKTGSWQSVRAKNGFIAFQSKSLDQAWPSAEEAALEVSAFIANASWFKPLAFFSDKSSNSKTTFSTPFVEERAWGFVSLSAGNGTRRFPVFVQRPRARMWTASEVVWPKLFPLSFKNISERMRVEAESGNSSINLGELASKTSFVSTAIPSEHLENKEYRIVLKNSKGLPVSASFLRVKRFSAKVAFADYSTKTFYITFTHGENPLRFQEIKFRSQSFFTNADGVAKFKDHGAKEGKNSYVFLAQGAPITADVFFQPPLLSFSTISVFFAVLASALLIFFSRRNARVFVVFEPPAPMPFKKIVLDSELLRSVVGKNGLTIEEIAVHLCRRDPLLRVDAFTLENALQQSVKRGWLKQKGEKYFSS